MSDRYKTINCDEFEKVTRKNVKGENNGRKKHKH